jgi:hypothetical protein
MALGPSGILHGSGLDGLAAARGDAKQLREVRRDDDGGRQAQDAARLEGEVVR